MSIQNIFKVAAICTGLILAGCGGSSGGTSTSNTTTSNTTSTVSLTGVVVDGYLGGATAFLDLNGNGALDTGEPSAITKSDGTYDLSVTAEQAAAGAAVVVDVPATAIDADTGTEVGKRFVMSAPPAQQGAQVVVSPMTTLVKSQMDKDASLTPADAEAKVKEKIGLTGKNVDLLSDYVAAKNAGTVNATDYERVHSIARVSAQAVKNNMAAVEAVAKAAGVNASVNDIVTLIVDQVIAELSNIALQVDLVPATALDPAAALANTNVNNISKANVAQDIQAIQAAAKKPVITLNGSNQITIVKGNAFTDPGAVALSNIEGDISANIKVNSNVNTNKVGVYTISYDVADSAGNKANQELRVVTVVAVRDKVLPVITLNGATVVTINSGTLYTDPGFTAVDNVDGDISKYVVVKGHVDAAKKGKYTITYDAVDGAGNKAVTKTRTVYVVDGTPPVVFQLLGDVYTSVIQGGTFTDPGVFAWDATDGDISANVVITGGPVNTAVVGTYTLTYNVSDAAGNAAPTLTRTVTVATETVPPVVVAPAAVTVEATGALTTVNLGTAAVTDNVSTNLTATASPVGPYAVGVHTITWTATDAAGNVGTATQTVTVVDTTAPTITAPASITTPATAVLTPVTLGVPTGVSDLTSTPTVLNDAPAGGFPVGTTTVTWTAIDAYNNTATATQTVTVTDNVAPVVTAPASVSLLDTNTASIAAFLNGATAIDNIDGTLTVTNNAPTPLPTGTTLVTFSATDTAGNTSTATASITINVAGAINNVPVTVTTDGTANNTNQIVGTPGPIANAVVVVDGVEYITDANGNTTVPGLDVGVHDVHVFATGYSFLSVLGYTSDPAGSAFVLGLPPTAPTPTANANYDSWVPQMNLTMPTGYVQTANTVIEVAITDPYSNTSATQAYNTFDPYSVIYSTNNPINVSAIPTGSSFNATIDVIEISCDPYGFNCTQSAFPPIAQTLTTVPGSLAFNPVATPPVAVTVTGAPAGATPFNNTANSIVVADVNVSNLGVLDNYTQGVNVEFIFSTTDANGVTTDYTASIPASYTFDPYTGQSTLNPSTISKAIIFFQGVPANTTLTGNLYAVESVFMPFVPGSDPGVYVRNYVNLGQKTFTTTPEPYKALAYQTGAATAVINASFPLTPAYPTADASINTGVYIDMTVSNSIYSDPNTVVNIPNGYVQLVYHFVNPLPGGGFSFDGGSTAVSTTTTFDAYGAPTTTVNPGPVLAPLNLFNNPPAGSTVTGTLTVEEVVFDYTTGTQTTVQFVDLGLQTFTVQNMNRASWKGFLLPATAAISTPVNVVFPAVPPTSTTVLTLQSVTPPAGMVVSNVNIYDQYSYADYLGYNGSITLPHTFTSFSLPQGLLEVRVEAYDPYSGFNWASASHVAVGSVLNVTSRLTTYPTMAPNQSGPVINFNLGGAIDPTSVGLVNIGDYWTFFVDTKVTSITLPPVPASVVNPLVVGQTYYIGIEANWLGNNSYNVFMKNYLSVTGGMNYVLQMDREFLGNSGNNGGVGTPLGIPYTY